MSVGVAKGDVLLNFVVAISGLPSELRSQVQMSQNSSFEVKFNGDENFVLSNGSSLKEGVNFCADFPDSLDSRLITSTGATSAEGGTTTCIEKSDELMIVPLTLANQTSSLAGSLLKPLPEITIVSFTNVDPGSIFWTTGACP